LLRSVAVNIAGFALVALLLHLQRRGQYYGEQHMRARTAALRACPAPHLVAQFGHSRSVGEASCPLLEHGAALRRHYAAAAAAGRTGRGDGRVGLLLFAVPARAGCGGRLPRGAVVAAACWLLRTGDGLAAGRALLCKQ